MNYRCKLCQTIINGIYNDWSNINKIKLFIIVDPYMKGEFIAPPPGKILNLRRFSLTHPGGWKIKWRQRALYQKLNKERFPDFCVQARGIFKLKNQKTADFTRAFLTENWISTKQWCSAFTLDVAKNDEYIPFYFLLRYY